MRLAHVCSRILRSWAIPLCVTAAVLSALSWMPRPAAAIDFFGLLDGSSGKSSSKSKPAAAGELARIKVAGSLKQAMLQSFAVNSKGELIVILADRQHYGETTQSKRVSGGELLILSSEGKQLGGWKLDFEPQRVAVGPDDEVFVGGAGQLARYSAAGKLLCQRESPHLADVLGDRQRLRKIAEEERQSQIAMYSEQIDQYKQQLADFDKQLAASGKKPGSSNPEPAKKPSDKGPADFEDADEQAVPASWSKQMLETQKRVVQRQIRMYEDARKGIEKQTVDDVIADITFRLRRLHAITVGGRDVFVATAMAKGYGFAIWRMNLDFQDAKQITGGLSGCCGQMDIQARGDELFVAENSKKRVCRFDREGKRLGQFGKGDREGSGGSFGGCCNPMNLCFMPGGDVLTAESEGRVKCFTAAGKFQGLVGKAKVSGGCKNVAIGLAPDAKRLYFFNLDKSEIIVLAPHLSSDQPRAAKNDT